MDEQDDLTIVYMWAFRKGQDAAKARIEALEKALSELSYGWDCCAVSKQMKQIARAALGEKKE